MEYTARSYNRYYDYGRYREAEDTDSNDYKVIKKFIVQTLMVIFLFIGLNLAKQSPIEFIRYGAEQFIAYTKLDIPMEEYMNQINPIVEYIKVNILKEETTQQPITEPATQQGIVETTEQAIETEQEKTEEPKVELTQMQKDANSIKNFTSIVRPVNGIATSRFGNRTSPIDGDADKHTGVDLRASIGTPIKSAISGTVVEYETDNPSFGKYIKVKNGDIVTVYAHCSKLSVKKGQQVKQGDIIAYSGDTGKVNGPHLHFEVLWQGRYVDPGLVLPNAN